jgi:NADH-quinone oxidoreductase subunit N
MLTITLLSLLGLILLFVGFLNNIGLSRTIAVLGMVAGLGSMLFLDQDILTFSGLQTQLSFDAFAIKFSSLILFLSIFILFLSGRFIKKDYVQSAEFLAVLIFSLVGALMLTAFTHFITLFVGLEILGISLYILAGTDKKSPGSNEASLKYLLLGAFATGIILFGMALNYGATGSLDFQAIANLGQAKIDSSLFKFGLFFILIGLLFKVSAAPFHFWSPDVYEGSPNVVMLFMSVVVKIASFAAIYRVFGNYLSNFSFFWWDIVYYATLASLVIGNLLALVQKTVKRQLAFSSISQTGYLLFALLVIPNGQTVNGLVFYLFVYGCSVLVAFSVLTDWFGTDPNVKLDQLKGASKSDQMGSFALTVAYLSMAGIPLTGGFFAKLFMFAPAMESGLVQLLIVGIFSSVVGATYYLRPVINVWFSSETPVLEKGNSYQWIAVLAGTLLLVAGVFPDTISNLIALI